MKSVASNLQGYILAALGAVIVVAAIVWFTSGEPESPVTAEQPKADAAGAAAPPPAPSTPSK